MKTLKIISKEELEVGKFYLLENHKLPQDCVMVIQVVEEGGHKFVKTAEGHITPIAGLYATTVIHSLEVGQTLMMVSYTGENHGKTT